MLRVYELARIHSVAVGGSGGGPVDGDCWHRHRPHRCHQQRMKYDWRAAGGGRPAGGSREW